MNLPHLDRSDRRTIELITERHPDIKDDLERILQDIDRSLGEKTKEIKDLQQEVQELKDEVHDLLNA
jgi:hypothetical protein